MTKMYSELLKDEFDLTVITAHANNKTKSFLTEFEESVKIVRIPYIPFNRKGFLWRFMSIISFSFACIFAIRYVDKGSIIYTCGPPEVPYFGITAELIKFLRSAKHLGLVTDMMPDNAYDLGLVKSKSLRKIITSFSKWTYKRTDHILTTTKSLTERLTDYYSIQPSRISIVETPVDVKKFRPKPVTDPVALELSAVKDRFIILYSGSFGKMYDFDPILEAAKSIQEIDDKIFFIIRGDGEQKFSIQDKMQQVGLENTVLLGPVPDTEQIISFINIASICLEPIRDSLSIDLTHPSKIFEYWACNKPVISTSRGETALLIERCHGGIAVPPNDPQRLMEAIFFLYNNKEVAEKMANNGRELVIKEFSYESVKKRLIEVVYKTASS